MREAYLIFSQVLLVLSAIVYPFVMGFRDKGVIWSILSAWFFCFLSALIVCMGIPILAGMMIPDLGREMFLNWGMEMPLVMLAGIAGWIPASIAVTLGLLVRGGCKLWMRMSNGRLSEASRNGNPGV